MVKIVITITDEGQFNIEGPIHNPVQFHGMLAVATHIINKQMDEAQEKRVQLAPAGIMGLTK